MQDSGFNYVEAIHSAAFKKYHKAGIIKNAPTTNGVEGAARSLLGRGLQSKLISFISNTIEQNNA